MGMKKPADSRRGNNGDPDRELREIWEQEGNLFDIAQIWVEIRRIGAELKGWKAMFIELSERIAGFRDRNHYDDHLSFDIHFFLKPN